MNKFILSMKHLLGYSWLTVLSIATLFVGFQFVLYFANQGVSTDLRQVNMVILMSTVICGFGGLTLGSALRVFRSHHMWQISPSYRANLSFSVIFILAMSSLSFLWPMIKMDSGYFYYLIVPFFSGICAVYFGFGGNILERFLSPLSPAILYFLYTQSFSETSLLICASIISVYLSLRLFTKTGYEKNAMTFHEHNESEPASFTVRIKAYLNRWLGRVITRKLSSSNADITWSLTDPIRRLGIISVVNAFAYLALLVVNRQNNMMPFDIIMLIFIGLSPLSVIFESKKHISQLKTTCHLKAGINHDAMKNKLIKAINKLVGQDAVIMMLLMFSFASLMGDEITSNLIFSAAIIVTIAIANMPLLLLLNWRKMNGALVLAVTWYTSLTASCSALLMSFPTASFINVQMLFSVAAVLVSSAFFHYAMMRLLKKVHIERVL